MSIGRNDSCPCGSGKKYKKCHGISDLGSVTSPEVSRAAELKACDTELGGRLMRFARMRHGPHWMHDALESEGMRELSDAEMPIVIPWLQHFKIDKSGSTLADEWRRHKGRGISPDVLLLLESYGAAWVSLWEVAEVEPGRGSRLTDLLTREERFVHDVRSSSILRRFDTVLAIILTCDGVSFFGGAHTRPLPPQFADSVVRRARRLCGVRTRPVSPDKLRDPNMQLELLAVWNAAVEDMLDQPPPTLQNTDGDPFLLTRDDFAVVSPRDEVARRLPALAGVQEPEQEGDDTVFVVTRAGNPVHRSWDNTVIGRIVLSATRLTVETNSTRRADSLRSAVEAMLRGRVRFRLRKEENTDQLMADAGASAATGAERADKPLAPEMVVAMRQFREQHMRDWIDDAIPALGGLTPREAARLSGARPKLITLLKEFEQSEERLPEPQRIDLQWLREELGFS